MGKAVRRIAGNAHRIGRQALIPNVAQPMIRVGGKSVPALHVGQVTVQKANMHVSAGRFRRNGDGIRGRLIWIEGRNGSERRTGHRGEGAACGAVNRHSELLMNVNVSRRRFRLPFVLHVTL